MPWHIGKSKTCPASKPHAVIKDSDKSVAGCHVSEAKAKKQLAALYASEERSMSKLEQLKARINKLFEKEIEQERVQHQLALQTRSTVQRQKNGQHRLFSVSAVSAVNRVGEIDARQLFDSFVEHWQAGNPVERDFMHLGRLGEPFVTGDIDFVGRDGNVLVTSTLYRDTPIANGEIQERLENPDYWGDSVAYLPLDQPEFIEVDGESVAVFNSGTLRFISTVPEELAASHFTAGNMEQQEVGRMWNDLSESTKNELVKVLGGEDKAQAHWAQFVDPINRQIEEEELVTRTQKTETEPVVVDGKIEDVSEAKAEVVETVVELDDAAVSEVARRVAEADAVKALFTPLMERISQLEESVQSLSDELKERDKTEDVMRAKVAELERSEEEKLIEMVDDFPRRQKITVTHRPSINTNDEVIVSSTEQAESALEGWGKKEFYDS